MRILYVGFKGKHNASCQLVSSLDGEKAFLTNSFEGIRRDIDKITPIYDAVCMFGIDKSLVNSVRIEKCAAVGQNTLHSCMDTARIKAHLESCGIPATLSETPTHYLCNEAYYRMLEKQRGRVAFLHIPGLKHMTEDMLAGIIQSIALL